jgi:hypothetical protein
MAAEVDGSQDAAAANPTAAQAARAPAGEPAAPCDQSQVQVQLEWPLHVAVQYACAVLSRCGGLLSGLGHRLLAAVATCSAARLTAPALAAAADGAAQRRERSLARSRAMDALGGRWMWLGSWLAQWLNASSHGMACECADRIVLVAANRRRP